MTRNSMNVNKTVKGDGKVVRQTRCITFAFNPWVVYLYNCQWGSCDAF